MELTFGGRIKESRKAQKLTQKQLAEAIGAKHNSVSDWENDKNKPDPDTIELLCGVLKITPNYLLNSISEDFSFEEKQIINKYRNLDTQGKETVSYILDKETKRVNQVNQQDIRIRKLETQITPTRIITYYQRLASAGTGEYLFTEIPTDTITVKDTPVSRAADFVIGVNGKSMEPDYIDGEKVFVKKTTEINIGDVGIFVQGNDCYIKELGETHLISRNKDCPDIIPVSDVYLVGKVIGKVEG